MIMVKMLLGVMTLVAVMVIMLLDDNGEDIVRSDGIDGSDGDGSDGNNVDR